MWGHWDVTEAPGLCVHGHLVACSVVGTSKCVCTDVRVPTCGPLPRASQVEMCPVHL